VNSVITPDDTLFYPERDTILIVPFDPKYESGTWTIMPLQDQPAPTITRKDTAGLWISLEKKNFGDYKFVWKVDNGVCPVRVDTAYHSYYNILVYDGFSPNWDQYNQYLICEGISNIDRYEITIVNRLGEKVYTWSRNDRNDEPFPGEPEAIWDGNTNSGKALPEGTYYYILKVNGVHYKKNNKIAHYVVLRRKS
jgi:gliding motility-associated-like protein